MWLETAARAPLSVIVTIRGQVPLLASHSNDHTHMAMATRGPTTLVGGATKGVVAKGLPEGGGLLGRPRRRTMMLLALSRAARVNNIDWTRSTYGDGGVKSVVDNGCRGEGTVGLRR